MSKKRYLKANEVEAMLNETRDKDTDFCTGETAIVKAIIENAKRNGRMGDKIILVIPPYYLHNPEWQRETDLLRAREIGTNYNKNKWELPKVYLWNGKLYDADGTHRVLGAVIGEVPVIVVELMEITEDEAIDLFLSQGKDRNNMKPKDYYNASIKANKPDYISFRNICHKHNIQVVGDDSLDNPVGTFTPMLDGVRMDKKTLDQILTLINKLSWNGKATNSLRPSSAAYGSKVIRSIQKLYAYYETDKEQMEKILLSKCKGTEWFIKNLVGKSQYYIFDLLNKTVSDSIAQKEVISVVGKRTA